MGLQLKIRKMTEADLDAVQAIEQVSVPIPWSWECYQNEIQIYWACYLVCFLEEENKVIGYCGIWNVFEESNITTIVVDQAYRRHGAGRLMMDAMEQVAREKKAQKILLEVRPSNQAARMLYASLGFVEIARRTAYYPDNQEDALILCKYLDISLSGAVLL